MSCLKAFFSALKNMQFLARKLWPKTCLTPLPNCPRQTQHSPNSMSSTLTENRLFEACFFRTKNYVVFSAKALAQDLPDIASESPKIDPTQPKQTQHSPNNMSSTLTEYRLFEACFFRTKNYVVFFAKALAQDLPDIASKLPKIDPTQPKQHELNINRKIGCLKLVSFALRIMQFLARKLWPKTRLTSLPNCPRQTQHSPNSMSSTLTENRLFEACFFRAKNYVVFSAKALAQDLPDIASESPKIDPTQPKQAQHGPIEGQHSQYMPFGYAVSAKCSAKNLPVQVSQDRVDMEPGIRSKEVVLSPIP